MSDYQATNASSSGVRLDKKTLKALSRRSDRPGLRWLATWAALLTGSGTLVYLSLATWWIVPAMLLHGTLLAVPAYSLSHECAHGTAFRTRRLNEVVFWLSSLIYIEEPAHRRYAHARHHTYTWIKGKDAQMSFHTPLTAWSWFMEISTFGHLIYEARLLTRNALGAFDDEVIEFTPASELAKLKWGARAFLAIYGGLAAYVIVTGAMWPLVYIVVPRLVGGPIMQVFTITQHAELEEDQPSILRSTRSFRSGPVGRFVYMNMNNHMEHHLYPMTPFHALPTLATALQEQVPEPDPSVVRINAEVLSIAVRRSLGLDTTARHIRQADGYAGRQPLPAPAE